MVNEASEDLSPTVREARTDEYPLLAEHFLRMCTPLAESQRRRLKDVMAYQKERWTFLR
jgi:hypothetical protein